MNVSRVYRLLRLITMLQSGRSYTVDELAVELEISRRTVFRDLNMLELAHIPYYFDDARQGYGISKHFFLPPVNLTLSEALAVLMLAGRGS
ncbi:MAG: HTH domain-containing protein, partial [Planctomycetaceae bacterium]